MRISLLARLAAVAVLVGAGCAPIGQANVTPTPSTALPDTQTQQALVRRYIALVAAERFPDAWQLLAPERQRNEPPDAFAADWRTWGRLQPDCNNGPFVWPAATDEIRADVCVQHSPTAILLFARPRDGGWSLAGGGTIGTIGEMDHYAVSCAWTWLRFATEAPTTAAFYCTIEDKRVVAVELVTVEGARFRSDVAGQRAVLFPFAWSMRGKWPAQQLRALLLSDRDGHTLTLPTSPLAGPAPP